jgi:toxin secretion/phage lysis holin
MLETLLNGIDITKIVGDAFYYILGLIVLDILTGLVASAKERKLNSSVNFDGMLKKIGELLALVFVSLVDSYFQVHGQVTKLGVSMIVVYEGLSCIENFSRLGINLSFLTQFFDKSKIGNPSQKDDDTHNDKHEHD